MNFTMYLKKLKNEYGAVNQTLYVIIGGIFIITIITISLIYKFDDSIADGKLIEETHALEISLLDYVITNDKYPHPIKGEPSESLKCHQVSKDSSIVTTGLRDALNNMFPDFDWINAESYFYAVDDATNPQEYLLGVKLKNEEDPILNEGREINSDKNNSYVSSSTMGTAGNWENCSCNNPTYCIRGTLR